MTRHTRKIRLIKPGRVTNRVMTSSYIYKECVRVVGAQFLRPAGNDNIVVKMRICQIKSYILRTFRFHLIY